jgi:uncharacterized protein YfdQ (DUF2303 family)
MLNTETLAALRQNETLGALNDALKEHNIDATALPAGFSIVDLEKYREHRARLTGTMTTSCLPSFVTYVEKFSKAETTRLVMIDPRKMAATCAINFGSVEKPGHADHEAVLQLEKTSEYQALLKVCGDRTRIAQRAAAEWCEDYVDFCRFLDGDGITIPAATAIKAIRNLKIEANTKVGSGQGSFTREKSLLESTKVDTSEGLPHFIEFTGVPYKDLKQRTFRVRLGTGIDSGEATVFVMQIIRHDLDMQAMAEELADQIKDKMQSASVFLGSFAK